MSTEFNPLLDDDQLKKMESLRGKETPLGQLIAVDKKTALFERAFGQLINSKDASSLGRSLNRTVTMNINSIGDRKTIGDVDYILTINGWIRQPIGALSQ